MDWRTELRQQLDAVPGGAERLLRAIDEGRMDPANYLSPCGTTGCVYGHIYGGYQAAFMASLKMPRSSRGAGYRTELEMELFQHRDGSTIRPEVLVWLAEHGKHPELLGNPQSHESVTAQ